MNELELIWKHIKTNIENNLEKKGKNKSFMDYLNGSQLVEIHDEVAVITTTNIMNKVVLEDNKSIIEDAFLDSFGSNVLCDIMTEELYTNKINNEFESAVSNYLNDNIDPDFTFENFIEGKSNREAKIASLICATNPGDKTYNPLIIYGNSGLGKTHLLNAIGNYIKQKDPSQKLYLISSIDFVNNVISSIKDNTIEEYKRQLNSVDVLLVDDIQNLSGKAKTNEVFFSVYNELFNNRKQVVLTSDRPPVEIKDIEDRLKTRFSQGLSVTISSLEYETAYKILQLKLKQHNIDSSTIDDEVISFMAQNFSSNVRNLEGALNRLLFYSINFKNPDGNIDINLCLEAFNGSNINIKQNIKDKLEVKDIVSAVADYYGLTKLQIFSKTRTKNIATARHVSMYLCRKLLNYSYDKIGEEFGGKDHTTVLSAFEKIDKLVTKDEIYKKIVSDIEKAILDN